MYINNKKKKILKQSIHIKNKIKIVKNEKSFIYNSIDNFFE